MAEIIQSTLLRRDMLDERRYAESLLNAADELGLLDGDVWRRLLNLLTEQCKAFAGGYSRSLRRSRAESIRESTMFTLSAHLSRFEPLDALAQLHNRSIEACYRDGRRRVNALVKSAELFYQIELSKPFFAENDLLRGTLEGGLSGFFQKYNPEYGAHEIHITADYPTVFFPQGWQGIEFIRRYLENIALENRFLRLLPAEETRKLLSVYAAKNNATLRELCDNLYEIALACVLPEFDGPEDMLNRLGGDSPALRDYVLRTCELRATDLDRILRQMQ